MGSLGLMAKEEKEVRKSMKVYSDFTHHSFILMSQAVLVY